jgi:hypothetical protein
MGARCLIGFASAECLAHAGQVFVQLASVGGAYTLGKILGAIFYTVENADVLQAATVAKEVVPGERGVDRNGRVRTLRGEGYGATGSAEWGGRFFWPAWLVNLSHKDRRATGAKTLVIRCFYGPTKVVP